MHIIKSLNIKYERSIVVVLDEWNFFKKNLYCAIFVWEVWVALN